MGLDIRGSGSRILARRIGQTATALTFLFSLSGCSLGPTGLLAEGRATPIAFESIEGAPAPVIEKFTRVLNEEAKGRGIAVVRKEEAVYRLRGYLAAHTDPAAIAWAWDLYDGEHRRALRLSGDEKSTGRPSWSAIADETLRRIARASLDQLIGFMNGGRSPGGALAYAPID